MKIGICATVDPRLSNMDKWMNYHLNIGIDHIVVFVNDPLQSKKIPKMKGVTVVPCDEKYWLTHGMNNEPQHFTERQLLNLIAGADILRKKGCQWMAHIDADELIRPMRPIKDLLKDNKNWDVLRMQLREAVSDRINYDCIFDATLFRRKFFRGHSESKSIFRIDLGRNDYYGVHGVNSACRKSGKGLRIKGGRIKMQLLHYDCVGIENWAMKWRMRIHIPMRFAKGSRRQEQEQYIRASKRGSEFVEELFARKRIPKSTNNESIFSRIEIDQSLFNQANKPRVI